MIKSTKIIIIIISVLTALIVGYLIIKHINKTTSSSNNCSNCKGTCIDGKCTNTPGCTPNCSNNECGDDGCGGSCGICNQGVCQHGKCVLNPSKCTPNCSSIVCGSDGCGGSCGTCDQGSCQHGKCVESCVPKCIPPLDECGSDGCGGTCGTCASGSRCNNGKCIVFPPPSQCPTNCGREYDCCGYDPSGYGGCGGATGYQGKYQTSYVCQAGPCINNKCAYLPSCYGANSFESSETGDGFYLSVRYSTVPDQTTTIDDSVFGPLVLMFLINGPTLATLGIACADNVIAAIRNNSGTPNICVYVNKDYSYKFVDNSTTPPIIYDGIKLHGEIYVSDVTKLPNNTYSRIALYTSDSERQYGYCTFNLKTTT
jgi:hypothetical protein